MKRPLLKSKDCSPLLFLPARSTRKDRDMDLCTSWGYLDLTPYSRIKLSCETPRLNAGRICTSSNRSKQLKNKLQFWLSPQGISAGAWTLGNQDRPGKGEFTGIFQVVTMEGQGSAYLSTHCPRTRTWQWSNFGFGFLLSDKKVPQPTWHK